MTVSFSFAVSVFLSTVSIFPTAEQFLPRSWKFMESIKFITQDGNWQCSYNLWPCVCMALTVAA
jgi:hypothetical protein